ncbi:MAG: type II toxin-antitoxin system RelE/ParE family toxin [Bacteroidetes bacterium]|nr:type II toxin-antitoxin system RelE/ParE family toxin [Bacteroidota bacterium]
MAEYNLTKKAVEDLAVIWEYTFNEWSEGQADKYYKILLDNCQDIANNPDIGKNYEGIASELFGQKVNRHIIFYRKLINKPVEITRIIHERMD